MDDDYLSKLTPICLQWQLPYFNFHITVKNNFPCQHVELWNTHNFVASARFRASWWSEAHKVCGFSHQSTDSRRCNGLSTDFAHKNVMDYFLPCNKLRILAQKYTLYIFTFHFLSFFFLTWDMLLSHTFKKRVCIAWEVNCKMAGSCFQPIENLEKMLL